MRTDANDDYITGIIMFGSSEEKREEELLSMQLVTSRIVQILELWICTSLYLLGRYRSDGVTFAFILRVEELSSKFDAY